MTDTPGPIIEHCTEPTLVRQGGSSICRLCGQNFGMVWYLCDGCATDPRRTFDRKIVIARALHMAELAAAKPLKFRPMPDGTYGVYEWQCDSCKGKGRVKHAIDHEEGCPFDVLTYEERDAADKFSSDCGQDDRLTFAEEVERQGFEFEVGRHLDPLEYRAIKMARQGAKPKRRRGAGVKRDPKEAKRARTRA